MKQTAVEWLVEELSDVLGPMDTNSIRDLLLMDAISRAKEMEKEQMVDAWSDGWLNDYEYDEDVKNSAEQYYNKTFNTNEK
jgi:hypothetical protein